VKVQKQKYNIDEIVPLITATEIRDAYTQGHSQRVAYYAYLLTHSLQFDEKICKNVYIAGLLHDVGKIGIPDNILLKPGELDGEEFELIKLHSSISGKIVKTIPHYSHLSEIVSAHHENYDGSGYPLGLKAQEIPIEARLLTISDVFDALTTRRVYRAPIPFEKSLTILTELDGKFDPIFLDAFIKMIRKHGIAKDDIEAIKFNELEELRNSFFFLDPLTKALNRDGLLAILRRSSDYEYKVVLTFINIKHFKDYNKLYGLKKGDTLLNEISKKFQHAFSCKHIMNEPKHHDAYFARIHADKFALLYIGQREDFISYKLQEIVSECKKEFGVEISSDIIIKNKKLSHHIKNELGYLL